jgi:hypothetical protein
LHDFEEHIGIVLDSGESPGTPTDGVNWDVAGRVSGGGSVDVAGDGESVGISGRGVGWEQGFDAGVGCRTFRLL